MLRLVAGTLTVNVSVLLLSLASPDESSLVGITGVNCSLLHQAQIPAHRVCFPSFFYFFLFLCIVPPQSPHRNTRSSFCCSSSGSIRGSGTPTSPSTSISTRYTTTKTFGYRIRTSSCTATLRIRSYRCTSRCGYTATGRLII